MSRILKMEEWQLLLIFIALAFLSLQDKFGSVFSLLSYFVYLFWVYSITNMGFKKLNLKKKQRLHIFNINLFFLFFWSLLNSLWVYTNIFLVTGFENYYQIKVWGFYALNVYAFCSMIYAFYLASIILGSINEGKLVDFRKVLGYFIGFIVLPIGIWFIQPQARKLIDEI